MTNVFQGLLEDFRRPGTCLRSDFLGKSVFNSKVGGSICYMFATSIFPAITFASLIQMQTNNNIGVIEILLSSCITGCFYSLCSGQPITIVGVTGPTAILTIATYNMAKSWNIEFIAFYGCAQIWSFIMHVVLVMINSCELSKYISDFSCDIFGNLIAFIYIQHGLEDIIHGFYMDVNVGMFEFVVSIGVYWTCKNLSSSTSWVILKKKWKEYLSDYGPALSLVVWSFVANATKINIRQLEIPTSFETTSGRSWLVGLGVLPTWAIFAAIFPGFVITVLFFFDHNISSLMAQNIGYKLKKPSTFHWDFMIVGFGVLLTGMLGIPPTCGLIPQSPIHSKSLSTSQMSTIDEKIHVKIVHVHEQRMSNLFQSGLMGMMCLSPFLHLLHFVPQSVLNGFFLHMGLSSFHGNNLANRFLLILSEPECRSMGELEGVNFSSIKSYICLQCILTVVIFAIIQSPLEIIFPILIGLLVPFRHIIATKYFSLEELSKLDNHNHNAVSTPTPTESVRKVEEVFSNAIYNQLHVIDGHTTCDMEKYNQDIL